MIRLEDINREKVYVYTEYLYAEFYKGMVQRVRFIVYNRTVFFSLASLLEASVVKTQDIFDGSNRNSKEVFCNYATEIVNAYPKHKEEDIVWRGYRPYVRIDLLVPMLKRYLGVRPNSPDKAALEALIEWLGSESFDKVVKEHYRLGRKHVIRPNAPHFVEPLVRGYTHKEYLKLLPPRLPELELEEARFDKPKGQHSPRALVFVKTRAATRNERKFYAIAYKDIVYLDVAKLISIATGASHVFLDDWGGLGIGRRDINAAWCKDLAASTKALHQLTYTKDRVASVVMFKGEVFMTRRGLLVSLKALVDRIDASQRRAFLNLISWLEAIRVRETIAQVVKTREQPKRLLFPLHPSYCTLDKERAAKKAAKRAPRISAERRAQLERIKAQKEASNVICYQGQTFKKSSGLASWDYPSLKELLAAREGNGHARH